MNFKIVSAKGKIPRILLKKSLSKSILDITSTWFFILIIIFNFPTNNFFLIPSFLLIGIFQHRLLQLSHHGFHGDFSQNKKINDFLGRFLVTAPLLGIFSAARKNHLKHHSDFGGDYDYERINYDWSILKYASPSELLYKLFGVSFFSAILSYFSRYITKKDKTIKVLKHKYEILDLFSIFTTQILILFLTFKATNFLFSYFILWIAPGILVGGSLNRIRNFLEHSDPNPNGNPYLTFKSNFFERFILSPFNFNYHAEHHIYPKIPYYNIPKARKLLKKQNLNRKIIYCPSYISRLCYLLTLKKSMLLYR